MKNTPENLAQAFDFKLTQLRRDILQIFINSRGRLAAYAVLDLLQKTRKTAKPITVYRVLDFLAARCVIHRINADNSYILCQIEHHTHVSTEIVIVCSKCDRIVEFTDSVIHEFLKKIAQEHSIKLNTHLLEISGLCSYCSSRGLDIDTANFR
jgi:Fur family transcriptional regulator, zinc uptake regulator